MRRTILRAVGAAALVAVPALPRWCRLTVTPGVVLALLVAATVSATAVRFARLVANIDTVQLAREEAAVPAGPPSRAAAGRGVNVLVVGSDARDDDPLMGDRADSMVLVHLSEDRTRIDALQIPRDTVLDLPGGAQVLDGDEALAWSRARCSIGDGSDIGRMGNQQTVMHTIVDRVRDRRLATHPRRAHSFLDAVTSSVRTDTDLARVPTTARLGLGLARVPPENISIETMPWVPDVHDPDRVVPAAEAEEIFAALALDVPALDRAALLPGEEAPAVGR